ncbi:hypothetical protein FVB9532_02142 [Mesonia oceanica]|uniref:Uncharacterized protein n=1 Tax=Mesonia oceanica TaxID=2687242 RepID=A0AC61Y8N0_9FLAO|nr:hypothetical protein FVB9532_02142 [Mesonia oceanica]
MNKEKHLYRILFLVSIFLLLINDLYLKFEYHNYLTGKLSDFVGLFAFPYFFSCFFSKKIKLIYILSGILFVFWKLELSQPIFDFANSYGIGINRTVDYSDLMALMILPFSYSYWNKRQIITKKPKRIFKPIIIVICSFSFIATTLAAHIEELNLKSDFQTTINYDLETVKKELRIYHDSIVLIGLYKIDLENKNAEIWTKISLRKTDSTKTQVSLDSILDFKVQGTGVIFYSGIDEDDVEFMKKLTKSEIEQLFKKSINKEFMEK